MRMRYGVLPVMLLLAITFTTASAADIQLPASEVPRPSIEDVPMELSTSTGPMFGQRGPVLPGIQLGPPLIFPAVDCYNFNDNSTVTGGFVFIPPDPHVGVGPNHVINIGNVAIEWRTKANPAVRQNLQSLQSFFSALPPYPGAGTTLGTFTFDPKVIYDQYADRWVVLTMERWRLVAGDPADESRLLVAVSQTPDPNGAWWFHSIDSKVSIGGTPGWADYPGLAVDDKAVYITANYFSFPGAFLGNLVWIIDKGPTYAGPNNSIVATSYDAYAATSGAGSVATTTQPAHMWGPVPGTLGTWLVSHSGLTNGFAEFIQTIRINNPLGVPTFTHQFIAVGDIDANLVGLPDAPQSGTPVLIEVNDRRALNAVWRDNCLYTCATILPNAGPDLNETTAHWWALSSPAAGPVGLLDQGNVGSNDLGAGTYTFFPSVMIDCDKNMAIGYAASNSGIFCGAYYSSRMAGDPAGSVGATCTLMAGTDFYIRTFGGPRNRWGDYSGLALCPTDESTFYVYNEYACTRGTVIGGEDGRWCTKLGAFFLKQTVAVAISSFDAIARDGYVELNSEFAADFDILGVNVYRGNGDETSPGLYQQVLPNGNSRFDWIDSNVEPGKSYSYRIGVMDKDGEFFSPLVKVSTPGASFSLGQNAPNPFNPTTTISFTLPEAQSYELTVFDASGRLVKTLSNGVGTAGTNDASWDGTNNAGARVVSGVYYYRLTAGNLLQTRKMVLLK